MQIDILNLKDQIRKVGDAVMELYEKDIKIEDKADASPVTEADLLSNKLLVEILEKTGIPVLSEEIKDSPERLKSEKLWIIDPLDGTKDFIQKTGEFSIMVGLVEKGEPILGIVYAPALGKMYFAEKGKGAFVETILGLSVQEEYGDELEIKNEKLEMTKENDQFSMNNFQLKQLQVSEKQDFRDWTILVSRNHLGKEEVRLAESLEFREKRPTGSIGVKLGMIAEGEAEVYLHAIDKTWEWDVAAAEIILKEAGGEVTDKFGKKLEFNKVTPKNFNGILATNGLRHGEVVCSL